MKYTVNKSDNSETINEICGEFDTREEAEEFMQNIYLEYLDIIAEKKELFIEEDYYNIKSEDSHHYNQILIRNKDSEYSLYNAKNWSTISWCEIIKNIPIQIHSEHIVYEIHTKKE